MNVSNGQILTAGVTVALSGVAVASLVAFTGNPEPEKISVPGPTVTVKEVREHKIPVPGPTVTKKVVETKTVRPKAPEVSRSNERKTQTYGSARDAARSIFGDSYSCIDSLITRESSWNHTATNPSSGAYGLPQALPGSKMASAGSDWQSNPVTQLRWMKSYVDSRYGGACAAWSFWQTNHWY